MISRPLDILQWINDHRRNQVATALVIVSDISGGTLRQKGAMMGVTLDHHAGYISAGCVDADIIAHARKSIVNENSLRLHYGEGSPFRDITLPCGGKIIVNIFQGPDLDKFEPLTKALNRRQAYRLDLNGHLINYQPHLQLRLVGRGAPFISLANAAQSGFEIIAQSPDLELNRPGMFSRFDHLTDPQTPPQLTDDPWTSVVCLFHDHDWETALLEQALRGPAFYVGAMGSDRTQALRREKLFNAGLTQDLIDRLRAPIGLIPAMRSSDWLAISVLAEIIQSAQKQGRL